MAEIWVTKPGEEAKLPAVQTEAARLQPELQRIQSLSDELSCKLCGDHRPLTREHAPSKKSGNQGPMRSKRIDYQESVGSGFIKWAETMIQSVTFEALCRSCNNQTGDWYNPSYVKFARQCRSLAIPENAAKLCQLRPPLYLHRVVKQALVSFVATSQWGMTARYPHLRSLLLDRKGCRPLAPIQIWLYLRANPGGRYTGLTIAFEVERRKGHLVAGFDFWPLGWLMTIGDVKVSGAANVSAWAELDYGYKNTATVEIPCQWAISPYPGDFRGSEEFSPTSESWSTTEPTLQPNAAMQADRRSNHKHRR